MSNVSAAGHPAPPVTSHTAILPRPISQYHLVTTLHAARVELVDARKAGDAAAVASAEAQVATARAAVDAALADGRVVSAAHLLDLDLDSLGAILSHLDPRDALDTAHTCSMLRSALFRGGLPGPLAAVCRNLWQRRNAATKEAALRALDGMEPALGALRLFFRFEWFDEGFARVLARALDAVPRAARIDIAFGLCYRIPKEDDAGRLADVLSSHERTFASRAQVHVRCDWRDAGALLRLARAGVCIASMEQCDPHFPEFGDPNFIERVAANAANTLTQLHTTICPHVRAGRPLGTLNLPTRFPALRRLTLDIHDPGSFTTNVPSLTALAPHLKDIEFNHIFTGHQPPKHGFGFEPRRFARFVDAIQGVTRVRFGPHVSATLTQNVNENLRQLTALCTLRDLEISCADEIEKTFVALGTQSVCCNPLRAPVADDAITKLPPLPPGLTRLAFSGVTRVAFGHPLPELRVLDWRGSRDKVSCLTFHRTQYVSARDRVQRDLHVPLAIPSAALAPNLHTLLIGYRFLEPRGDFDLWTLVAARTTLRVVVIEHARLMCSAPDGFETTTAILARKAKDLVSVHMHECVIEGAHQLAVKNFFLALQKRGVRMCWAGVHECLFCMLHDGADLWSWW